MLRNSIAPDASGRRTHVGDGCDVLQAAAAHVAELGPLPLPASLPPAEPAKGAPGTPASASLEDLWPTLVRKVAWFGDARRATVRMELGAGALAGATVLVHSENGHVRVELRAPPHVNVDDWRARIAGRLACRGLNVEGIDAERPR
jgi:hypothetical protein